MKNKLLTIGLLIAGLFLISACHIKTTPLIRHCEETGECAPQNGSNNAQIANPASKFCVDNGGQLEIRTAEDGSQSGFCKIKGQECEEWALMRGECTNIHFCTDTEKAAEICTMEYMPVCGNDGVTYGNKCGACAAKANYWVSGECAK